MITTYEVRNVLRIYGNHLKKRSIRAEESESLPYAPSDLVDISMDARRRQMVSQMSNHLISQIIPAGREGRSDEREQGTVRRPALAAGAQGVI
ncbi:MAG: DVU0524 family FlgM-associated protein [Thermodesulfobacteriota bacterium]